VDPMRIRNVTCDPGPLSVQGVPARGGP